MGGGGGGLEAARKKKEPKKIVYCFGVNFTGVTILLYHFVVMWRDLNTGAHVILFSYDGGGRCATRANK